MSRLALVVVPRERYGAAEGVLDAAVASTRVPLQTVVVDAGASSSTAERLARACARHDAALLRSEAFLTPNQARNLATEKISAEYVLFLDNDVVLAPGAPDALVRCADETGADVVGPLYCMGTPLHRRVHMAGGLARFEQRPHGRRFVEHHLGTWQWVDELDPPPTRAQSEHQEFHCMLVRKSALDAHGPLDESLLTITETQLDFCLRVRLAGGQIWTEPRAVCTYLRPPPFEPGDLPYYLWRWNDAWITEGLRRFADRWGLAPDDPFPTRRRRWAASHRLRPWVPVWRALRALGDERRHRLAPTLSRAIDRPAAAALRLPLEVIRPPVPPR
jgi:cellulose synthase/poly-beta-1,6-N-acetylglucosamine synthase-like glycosyltransferase